MPRPWDRADALWTILDQSDRDSRVARLHARARQHDPDATKARHAIAGAYVAQGDVDSARSALLDDPALPDIETLRAERTVDSAYAMALHPQSTDEELRRLAVNCGQDIALTVARNPLAPLAVIEAISEAHPDASVAAIAGNPGTPHELLVSLASRPHPTPKILANPALPAEWMRQVFDLQTRSSGGWQVIEAQCELTANVACPYEIWSLAAQSPSPRVRDALVRNHAAPDELRAVAAMAGL